MTAWALVGLEKAFRSWTRSHVALADVRESVTRAAGLAPGFVLLASEEGQHEEDGGVSTGEP